MSESNVEKLPRLLGNYGAIVKLRLFHSNFHPSNENFKFSLVLIFLNSRYLLKTMTIKHTSLQIYYRYASETDLDLNRVYKGHNSQLILHTHQH